MQFKDVRVQKNMETKLWITLKAAMRADGWYVKKMHGSKFQSGLPDVLAGHIKHGTVFIELKIPPNTLSLRQQAEFRRMAQGGIRVYLIKSIEDYRSGVLLRAPNWTTSALFRKRQNIVPSGFF